MSDLDAVAEVPTKGLTAGKPWEDVPQMERLVERAKWLEGSQGKSHEERQPIPEGRRKVFDRMMAMLNNEYEESGKNPEAIEQLEKLRRWEGILGYYELMVLDEMQRRGKVGGRSDVAEGKRKLDVVFFDDNMKLFLRDLESRGFSRPTKFSQEIDKERPVRLRNDTEGLSSQILEAMISEERKNLGMSQPSG